MPAVAAVGWEGARAAMVEGTELAEEVWMAAEAEEVLVAWEVMVPGSHGAARQDRARVPLQVPKPPPRALR